jgi:hypothetical protein
MPLEALFAVVAVIVRRVPVVEAVRHDEYTSALSQVNLSRAMSWAVRLASSCRSRRRWWR